MRLPDLQTDVNLSVSCFKTAPALLHTTQVSVIVPVRNEAEHIWQMLDALRLQTNIKGEPVPHCLYEVLVLINNNTDSSAEIAARYQQQYPDFNFYFDEVQLPATIANVGTVRRMLMDKAYERLTTLGHENSIIASTDGDTIVDSCWLHHIMAEVAGGYDAVGGRILTKGHVGHARQYHLKDVTYRCLLAKAETMIDPHGHGPMPRHFQYFGASLAVTCKMYRQAGRLPQVPHLEDVAFHKALLKHDARIRQSFDVKVYTSARLEGRVAVGFSEQLRKWTHERNANVQQTVEPVNYSLLLIHARSRLRRCWQHYKAKGCFQSNDLWAADQLVGAGTAVLAEQLATAAYFGKIWDSAEQILHHRYALLREHPQLIDEAIAQLRELIAVSSFTGVPASLAGNWAAADGAAA